MKKYLAILSFGVVFGVHGVDLEEAVVSAYFCNTLLESERASKRMADEQYKQAEAMFLPTLNASLSASRTGSDQSGYIKETGYGIGNYRGLPVVIPAESYKYNRNVSKQTRTQMALQFHQNLFNSFQNVENSKAKKNLARASFHKLKKAEQDLIVSVVKTYTAVWAERQKLQAYMKKEENLKKLYESQEICLSAGMSTPADVAEAESKYQTAVYERVDAETKVIEAEAQFKQITGLDADPKMFIPNLNIKLPENLDQLEKIALRSNQEILQEKFIAASALNDLDVARGALGPKCDLKLEAGRNLNKTENLYGRTSQNVYNAELSVTVPVFNMPNYANIGVHSERAKYAEFKSKDKILEIKRNCKIYWRAYKSAEASIKASSTAVKSAEITSESNLDQANLGMKSNTEFLDVETSLLTARINLAKSIKNKIDAMIELFALTGNLDLRSMLVTLKKNKGVLDPVAAANAREQARRVRKSGKKLSRKEWIKQLAEKKLNFEKNKEKRSDEKSRLEKKAKMN